MDSNIAFAIFIALMLVVGTLGLVVTTLSYGIVTKRMCGPGRGLR